VQHAIATKDQRCVKDAAKTIAKNAMLIDEFIARETDIGRINRAAFTSRAQAIELHGHCY
jgi:hypothetical protein